MLLIGFGAVLAALTVSRLGSVSGTVTFAGNCFSSNCVGWIRMAGHVGPGKPTGVSQLLVQAAQLGPFAYPFWQEPKTDQDEEHCRKVNECLNNPPMPGALGASGSGGHELSALGGNYHLDLCGALFIRELGD